MMMSAHQIEQKKRFTFHWPNEKIKYFDHIPALQKRIQIQKMSIRQNENLHI